MSRREEGHDEGCRSALLLGFIAILLAFTQNTFSTTEIDLAYPEGASYVLNVGSHQDPPEPFENVFVIAFEPLTEIASQVQHLPDRYVVNAAIGETNGIAAFRHFKDSSSLLSPHFRAAKWHRKGLRGQKVLVPLLSSYDVMLSLRKYRCLFLKTDMQGMDFRAVQNMGELVKGCHWLLVEAYCKNFTSYAQAVNDFDRDWVPMMHRLGFQTENKCRGKGEKNILWENKNFKAEEVPYGKCPKCYV